MPTLDLSCMPCCSQSSGASSSSGGCCGSTDSTVIVAVTGTGTCGGYTETSDFTLTSPADGWDGNFSTAGLCLVSGHIECVGGQYTATLNFISTTQSQIVIPLSVLSCDPLHLYGESDEVALFDDPDGDRPDCECTGTFQVEVTV